MAPPLSRINMGGWVVETFGLTPLSSKKSGRFPMPNGTSLDLYAPDATPAYGFNEGIMFGFRVEDIEAASAEVAAAGSFIRLRDLIVLMNASAASSSFVCPSVTATAGAAAPGGDVEPLPQVIDVEVANVAHLVVHHPILVVRLGLPVEHPAVTISLERTASRSRSPLPRAPRTGRGRARSRPTQRHSHRGC